MSNLQIDLKPKVMKTTLRILRVDVGSAHYVQGKGQRKLAKMQNERGQLLFYSSDSSPLFTLKFYLCVSEWSGGIKSSGCPPICWLSHEGAIRAEQATQDNELGWRGVCQCKCREDSTESGKWQGKSHRPLRVESARVETILYNRFRGKTDSRVPIANMMRSA